MPKKSKIKALGLFSGGLDSILAAALMKSQGIDVIAVHFSMPWGCGNLGSATRSAKKLDIPLKIVPPDEDFMDIVKKPRFGTGSAVNPCVDCKIYMIRKTHEMLKSEGARFLFTGEVLGQRPMSQLKHSLRCIEKNCGAEGLLVRPLSGKILPETIPEKEGWIKREDMLNICGRGRTKQIALAEQFHIKKFPQPAGGCLLTDKHFARRIKDAFKHGYRSIEDITSLKWGRHFRIRDYKITLGRDADENQKLLKYAHKGDTVMLLKDVMGPLAVVKGANPSEDVLQFTAGLIQHFSRYKGNAPKEARYWEKGNGRTRRYLTGKKVPEKEIKSAQI